MKDPRDVIISPIVSEKSYGLMDAGQYTFVVAPGSNKTEIRQAIESIFSVRVDSVNTLVRKGKRARNRRTGKYHSAPDQKRAIVTLKGDDRIPLFDN
jgi:large subunit ribosomal protein L23